MVVVGADGIMLPVGRELFLLVEHDMSFVMGTCQFIHVLDFGTIIATGTPAEVQANAQVQAAYLGTETVVEAS
jgi:branched-chain amino acid transport system ATP-binding protein